MEQLEEQFDSRLWDDVRKAHELGFRSIPYERMLKAHRGRETAKRLVASGDLQEGLRRLASMGLLHLSMEKAMLEEVFAPLFTSGELDAARWRLDQLN